jgi:hypothetical protein
MAHFAELDDNNKVIRVLVTDNNDPNGDEGYQFLVDTFGGTWVKTSYNASIRYNFAGIGFTYNPIYDAFIAPAPCEHDTLILNELKRWGCKTCAAEIMQSGTTA